MKKAAASFITTQQLFFNVLHLRFFVKARVKGVEVLAVKVILRNAQSLAETLEVHDLTGAQELDGVTHIGVVGKSQNIVVYRARLLLRRHVLGQIGNGIAPLLAIFRVSQRLSSLIFFMTSGLSAVHFCEKIRKHRNNLLFP